LKGSDGCKENRCSAATSVKENVAYDSKKHQHNHPQDPQTVELFRLQGTIKQASSSSQLPPRKLIAEHLKNSPKTVHPLINVENVSRNIRHQRYKANMEPSNLKRLEDLVIPERLRLCDGEDILKYDGWLGTDRILIFSTIHLLDVLQDAKDIGCDGTFSVSPTLFDQLWAIHVRLAHTFVPVVYCLLSSRTEATYIHVLNQLKALRAGLDPKSVSSDFEKSELNALGMSSIK
jgi:hypothetical protein